MSTPRIAALYVYPIKSCAGITTDALRFDAMGPLDDRRWMLVDDGGQFLTQREVPALALVRPSRQDGGLRVIAPGMPPLAVTGSGGTRTTTWCWDDRCAGFDEGIESRAWFSEYLGRGARLLRFDTTMTRAASRSWVGDGTGAPGTLTRFTDGFPLLVVSKASLDALNARLVLAGVPEATIQRFRPNIVVDGIDAFEEDLCETLTSVPFRGPPVVLRPVKPCTRCTIPEVDPGTGRHESGILLVLAGFRADPRLGGAATFGMNAVVTSGLDGTLRVGDPLTVTHRFA